MCCWRKCAKTEVKRKDAQQHPKRLRSFSSFFWCPWSPAFTFVWPIMFQLVWRTPAWFSTCIYTRSAQYLTSVYCPCYIFAVKWQRVKTHLSCCPGHLCVVFFVVFFGRGVCLFSLLRVALNLCSEIMFVKLLQRSGRITGVDVSYGCHGLKASCLKCRAVFVFPGGGWGLRWLHSAVAPVVDWLCHSPDKAAQCLLETQKCRSISQVSNK